MENFFINSNQLIVFTELFVMMFGAFLIGYFFGNRKINKGNKSKGKLKGSIKKNNINDIETLFTEIKPEIIKIIEKHNKSSNQKKETSLTLNFENFGYAKEIDKDDLTKIEGIGPFVEDKLNKLGVYTYDQISRFTPDDIIVISRLIENFPEKIKRDDWVGQANSLIKRKATQ